MNLLIFILTCFGLTQILVYGRILDYIRPKHYFFHCPMCVGFWVGIFIYILTGNFVYNSLLFWEKVFMMGCVSSGTSYALSSIFSDEGINIKHN